MKKTIIVIVTLAALLFVGVVIFNDQAKVKKQMLHNISILQDSVDRYSIEVRGLKEEVTQKEALILSEKEAKKAGLLEVERLRALHIKALQSNVTLEGQIRILQNQIANNHPDTTFIIITDTTGIDRNYLKIPFTLIDISQEYISLKAGMKGDKDIWFDLAIPIKGEVSIGYQKSGFLKTKPVGVFTTPNPYINITEMNVVVIDNKKWWDNNWLTFGLGVGIGGLGMYFLTR